MNTRKRFSPEVRERAVRLVEDQQKDHQSQWSAIQSIADKIGCTHETLRRWVRQSERDQGRRSGLSTDDREELKQGTEVMRQTILGIFQPTGDRGTK